MIMEEVSTDSLRKLAPCWTLAGDEKLLTILQNTHQRLLARCQEANSHLEQMASTLDDTNICLQNVNNQFMSLSSSQFIESRVYDDDVDITTEATPAKQDVAKSSPPDSVSMLKNSINVLESRHEVITIINDSDTSDTEDDIPDRQVMKAKDMYCDRPLPYIIGSEPWKNKWHAGLMAEDSDSESSTSKVERDSDQYSHSEPEDFAPDSVADLQRPIPGAHVKNISESSSEAPFETTSTPKQTPADIASEIARRLGAVHPPPKVIEREPEYDEPTPARKIYKPQEPISSRIFPDEPPPLDEQVESDSDIFADLHRKQPYNQSYIRQDVTQELFGRSDDDDGGDIFSDLAKQPSTTKPTSLFDAGPKPHMFDKQKKATEKSGSIQIRDESVEASPITNVKKPVGGISVFGSNQGAEGVGAAVLNRKQRKSSSFDDASGNETQSQPSPIKQQTKSEKDIFEDLFATNQRKIIIPKVNNIETKKETTIKKDTSKPIDLFSDNLFDDIDDIFTTSIAKTTKDNKDTAIFDDGLFSKNTEQKTEKSCANHEKSLFDSYDDLFSEKPSASSKPIESTVKTTKTNKLTPPTKPTQSVILLDDDDDIFSDGAVNKFTTKQHLAEKNSNLSKSVETSKDVFKSPSLFGDDDDINDLFKEPLKSSSLTYIKSDVGTEKISTEAIVTMTEDNSERNYLSSNNDLNNTSNRTVVEVANIEKVPVENRNNNNSDIRHESNTMAAKNTTTIKNSKDEKTSDDFNQQHFNNEPTQINQPINNSHNISDGNTKMPMKHSDDDNENTNIRNPLEKQIFTENIPDENQPDENQPDIIKPGNDDNSDKKSSSDIFCNILSEPPVFEKPKEPKKSKNVNALFDDDSDDEFFFFKKNDIVSDDNIEETTQTAEKKIVIFTDLPPESDFNKITEDLDSNLFNKIPEPSRTSEKSSSFQVNNVFEQDNDILTRNCENENLSSLLKTIDKSDLDKSVTKVADIYKLLSEEIPENAQLYKETASDLTDDDICKENAVKSSAGKEPGSLLSDNVITSDTTILGKSLLIKDTASIFSENEDIFKIKSANSSSNINDNDDYLSVGGDHKDLFKSLPVQLSQRKLSKTEDQNLDHKPDEEQFKFLPRTEISNPDKDETFGSVDVITHENLLTEPSLFVEKSEKKVGKLKVGLNINVKALLPGASPKKVQTIDNPDGQTPSKDNIKRDDEKILQATIFEGKPDAEILDNKFSKERPRIQVKRRPSTRKARKEAVKISGINFGEDSTDNSSSIDDLPKNQTEVHANTLKKVESLNSSDSEESIQDIVKNVEEKCGLRNVKESTLAADYSPSILQTEIQPENINIRAAKSNSTTKVVYILNDEDIFNTSSVVTTVKSNHLENSQNTDSKVPNISHSIISDTVKDLVTNLIPNTDNEKVNLTSNTDSPDGFSIDQELPIKTLGKTYDAKKNSENQSSIFGDDNDDGIFENKKSVATVSIFDSDDGDGELFGFSKTKVKKVENIVEIKGSLFGDDEDDDDLFGTKTKKSLDSQKQTSKSMSNVKELQKSTEPVFQDPLSMFGDDD